MIENVNDFLSIAVILLIILFMCKLIFDEFIRNHNKYIKRLEDDYYEDIEDSNDE